MDLVSVRLQASEKPQAWRSICGWTWSASYLKATTPTTEALTQAGFETKQHPQTKKLLVAGRLLGIRQGRRA
jgi:hypothetical protein